eukprot:128885-Pyramimonas_sp.AAC.1
MVRSIIPNSRKDRRTVTGVGANAEVGQQGVEGIPQLHRQVWSGSQDRQRRPFSSWGNFKQFHQYEHVFQTTTGRYMDAPNVEP